MKSTLLLVLLLNVLALSAQKANELWSVTTSKIVETDYFSPDGNTVVERVVYRSAGNDQSELRDIGTITLGETLFLALRQGRLTAYQDQALKKPFKAAAIKEATGRTDTVATVDPDDYSVSYSAIWREANPEDFSKVRLHLRLSYLSDGSLQQEITAASIAAKGNFDKNTVFYFPVNEQKGAIKLADERWGMVNRMRYTLTLAELGISEKSDEVNIVEHMTSLLQGNLATTFSSSDDWSPISPVEASSLVNNMDTIVVIDPITYEQRNELVAAPPLKERIDKLRLYQFWAWDAEKAELVISPIGYAPIDVVHDFGGKPLLESPAFNWAYPWYRKKD